MTWAKNEDFLSDDFDAVILITLRSVRNRSIKDEIIERFGTVAYEKVKESGGSRCLLILEGLDEMSVESQETDNFLKQVMDCEILEKAVILITSRPHACQMVKADRRIEVVGLGKKQIHEVVKKSFPNDANSVEQFLKQLKEFPHLESLSYVPINLNMIIDIFKCNKKSLPSTTTELYRLFIAITLTRQHSKNTEKNQMFVTSYPGTVSSTEQKLHELLVDAPIESIGTLFMLCKLAYCGLFNWYSERSQELMKIKDPKLIFTPKDLKDCGIEVTADWDGYGLLKATYLHMLPKDSVTFSFSHLSIQEFLGAVYVSTLLQAQQQSLLVKHFQSYPNVFKFLCGLTKLASPEMFQFAISNISQFDNLVVVNCLYESQQTNPPASVSPIRLDMSLENSLLAYDCLCISYVLSVYPVSQLRMIGCHIGDEGAKLLVKHYPSKNATGQLLEELNLYANDLSTEGMALIMKIVESSMLAIAYMCTLIYHCI